MALDVMKVQLLSGSSLVSLVMVSSLLIRILAIELAGDSFPELVNRFRDLFVFRLLEELGQGPGPIKPFGVDLDLLAVIGRDDEIHGPDIAAWIDLDGLT